MEHTTHSDRGGKHLLLLDPECPHFFERVQVVGPSLFSLKFGSRQIKVSGTQFESCRIPVVNLIGTKISDIY